MVQAKDNPILGWHFVGGGPVLAFEHNGRDGVRLRRGLTLRVKPPLAMCERGLHLSVRAIDALGYCQSGVEPTFVSRVASWGKIFKGDDKICAEYRKVLWLADCTATLHEFACRCAEDVLDLTGAARAVCEAAIAAKRGWLRGEVTDDDLAAAWYAAWYAAGNASRYAAGNAARYAAWAAGNASRYAARDAGDAAWAAGDAAWYAAWYAAGNASRYAARREQNRRLTSMLMTLKN